MSNAKVSRKTAEKSGMAAFSKHYLVLYNSVQTVGWGYMLIKTIKFLLEKQTVQGLWQECGTSVTIFQSLAVLEILHCIVGFVPSSAFITFLQVFSRVFMVWGILKPIEVAQVAPTLPLTLIAWGVTEVIRYSYYVTNILGIPARPLAWCRYSLFIGLYPAGVSGEVGNMLYSLDTIRRSQLFSLALPNKFNISFSFYYFCLTLLVGYIPTFPQLYMHMFHQRRKVLFKPRTKEGERKTK